MKQTWMLFRLFGIPVQANLSVALLAVYLVYIFFHPSQPLFTLGLGLYMAGVLLVSILLHELAHSLTARLFGGQVRDITLQLLGGCAAITRMPPKPWQECVMAFAGPLCSFILAGLCWVASRVFLSSEAVMQHPLTGEVFYRLVPNGWWELAAMLNLGLGAFNMVPAFPMDGGRILRSLLQAVVRVNKVTATTWAVYVGRGFAILWASVFALDVLFGVRILPPEDASMVVEYCWQFVFGSGSLMLLLIAYMIWVSGMRELQYVRAEAYYGGY